MKIYIKPLFFVFAIILLALAVFACAPLPAKAVDDKFDWLVVAVADGDTITVEPVSGGDRVKIRLYGIDCPEGGQPYGRKAREAVLKAALQKRANILVRDRDRYGRTVALVSVENAGLLQEMLLDSGLAWVYAKYCKSWECRNWHGLEARAREDGRGLWSGACERPSQVAEQRIIAANLPLAPCEGEAPVPPWEWRKKRHN